MLYIYLQQSPVDVHDNTEVRRVDSMSIVTGDGNSCPIVSESNIQLIIIDYDI